jgi:hypothetical protein
MQMCEMHIHNLDFRTILRVKLMPAERPITQQGIHTRGNGTSR